MLEVEVVLGGREYGIAVGVTDGNVDQAVFGMRIDHLVKENLHRAEFFSGGLSSDGHIEQTRSLQDAGANVFR